jgi:hypothetical protein
MEHGIVGVARKYGLKKAYTVMEKIVKGVKNNVENN